MHRSAGWLVEAFDVTVRPLLWNPLEVLRPHVRPGDRVADIGCGAGYYAPALSRLVGVEGELFLLDVQQQMLERALRRLRADNSAQAQVSSVLVSGDSFELPRQIDFALMSWMLHEVKRPDLLWAGLDRHLSRTGVALVIEPRLHVGRSRFARQLEPAIDRGFGIAEVEGIFFCRACIAARRGGEEIATSHTRDRS